MIPNLRSKYTSICLSLLSFVWLTSACDPNPQAPVSSSIVPPQPISAITETPQFTTTLLTTPSPTRIIQPAHTLTPTQTSTPTNTSTSSPNSSPTLGPPTHPIPLTLTSTPSLFSTPTPKPNLVIAPENVTHLHPLSQIDSETGNSIWSPNGQKLAWVTERRTVNVWDVNGNLGPYSFKVPGQAVGTGVSQLAFGLDGNTLISVSIDTYQTDYAIYQWDLESGERPKTLFRGKPQILEPPFSPFSIAFSPDLQTVASGYCAERSEFNDIICETAGITLWDVSNLQKQMTLTHTIGEMGIPDTVSFSPDGQMLAAFDGSATVRLWDVVTGETLITFRELTDDTSYISIVTFSPDWRLMAVGLFDGRIQLWDMALGKELHTLLGHRRMIRSLSFSPDGRILASTSSEEAVRLWDTSSGQEIHLLSNPPDSALDATFSPDGNILATVWPYQIILWSVTR